MYQLAALALAAQPPYDKYARYSAAIYVYAFADTYYQQHVPAYRTDMVLIAEYMRPSFFIDPLSVLVDYYHLLSTCRHHARVLTRAYTLLLTKAYMPLYFVVKMSIYFLPGALYLSIHGQASPSAFMRFVPVLTVDKETVDVFLVAYCIASVALYSAMNCDRTLAIETPPVAQAALKEDASAGLTDILT